MGEQSIAVIERGWHTDIGLPVEQISGPLARLGQAYPGALVLVFGFGDRDYFMSREETVGQTLAAMFPGPGVILVTALRVPAVEAFGVEHVVTLRLTRSSLDRVADFVWNGLEKQADGTPIRLGDGPFPGSAFYASSQSYALSYDCNAWTAHALHSGDLPVDPTGILFSGQIMGRVRAIAEPQDGAHRQGGEE